MKLSLISEKAHADEYFATTGQKLRADDTTPPLKASRAGQTLSVSRLVVTTRRHTVSLWRARA